MPLLYALCSMPHALCPMPSPHLIIPCGVANARDAHKGYLLRLGQANVASPQHMPVDPFPPYNTVLPALALSPSLAAASEDRLTRFLRKQKLTTCLQGQGEG